MPVQKQGRERAAGDARAVAGQGPGPGGPRRPQPAVVFGGAGRGAWRPRAHAAQRRTQRAAARNVRASGGVRAPRAPGDTRGRPRLHRAVLQAVLLSDGPEAHAPVPADWGTTAAAASGRPRTHANGAGPADRGGGESGRLSVGNAQAETVNPSAVNSTKTHGSHGPGGYQADARSSMYRPRTRFPVGTMLRRPARPTVPS